jgi:hypothetical protein
MRGWKGEEGEAISASKGRGAGEAIGVAKGRKTREKQSALRRVARRGKRLALRRGAPKSSAIFFSCASRRFATEPRKRLPSGLKSTSSEGQSG